MCEQEEAKLQAQVENRLGQLDKPGREEQSPPQEATHRLYLLIAFLFVKIYIKGIAIGRKLISG